MPAFTKHLLSLAVVMLFACSLPPFSRAQAAEAPVSKEVRRGIDSVRRGEYEVAVDSFKTAIEKAPTSNEARLGLSWAYLKQRNFPPSVEQALKVLEAEPQNARAHALIGAALMRVGFLGDASESFDKALAADPEEPLAVAGMAELDLYAGNLLESVKRARSAVSRSPREPDFLYLLGQAAARQELFEEAANAYERYLEVAPDVDSDRRARIRGLILLYRRLNGRNLYMIGGAQAADLPVKLAEGRLPIVELKVNGKGPYRFVIDSGAGFVVVAEDTARKLKLRKVAQGGTSRGVSGTGRFDIVYGVLDRIDMGGISIEGVPTYIRKISDAATERVDGYIGLSVLSHFRISVDYERKLFEVRRKEGAAAIVTSETDISVPYRITNGGMLSVSVDIGKDVPLNFIVDTGASSTVVSSRAFDKLNLKAKQHKGIGVRVVGAGGVTENVPVVVLDRIAIAGATTRQDFVRAIVLDLDPINETAGFEQGGIIGSDVLRFYRVEFDFDRQQLVLRPNGRSVRSSAERPPGGDD